MTRRRSMILACLTAVMTACGGAPPVRAPVAEAPPIGRRLRVVDDSTAPLGSENNPVRGNGPFGEREYLTRLRCPSGIAPAFERQGSTGPGGDSHILDAYAVTCPMGGPSLIVYMDMYHDSRERRAMAPFTVLPELPARMATGCPPQVGPTPDSSAKYVFNYLEVETPARALQLATGAIRAGVAGYAMVGFVVDTTGAVESSSITHGEYEEPRLQEAATRTVLGLRFRPAEHHAGCRVRQGTGLELEFQ